MPKVASPLISTDFFHVCTYYKYIYVDNVCVHEMGSYAIQCNYTELWSWYAIQD